MNKRVLFLIVGIILGLVVVFMVHGLINNLMRRIQLLSEEKGLVEVVVAKRDIPRETTITADMVSMEIVNRNTLQQGDLVSLSSVIGQLTESDILKGQYVNSKMIRSASSAQYLSQTIPVGMRAMTIPVDKISAVEGLIKPGDHVDIVATFAVPSAGGGTTPIVVTAFQGVKVLATDRNISKYKISQSPGTITLALTPEDVKNLTYILEWGQVKLVLRAPLDDTQEYGYTAVTLETLMRKLGMWQPAPPQSPPETIDVFKGAEKEEVPVSQK